MPAETNVQKAPIRLGIIGCGVISEIHGEAVANSQDGVTFAACADRNVDAANAFSSKYGGATVYTDMIEMVRKENLDGVVLATWPAHHYDHIRALVDVGVRHILCEKSLTASGEQASKLLDMHLDEGVQVMEGFMLRYSPVYMQLEELVRRGEVGKIDTIRSGFQEWDQETESVEDQSRKWRLQKASGGGVALDGSCYPLHVCTNLARSLPQSVSFDGDRTVYDTLARLHGHIRYENGIIAFIQSSLRAVVCKEAEVSGTEGSLYLPVAFGYNVPEHIAIRKRTGHSNLTMKDVQLDRPDAGSAYVPRISPRHQIEHFADIIRGGVAQRIPLVESVVNMFTLDAMVESAETRRVVDVKLPEKVRAAWSEAFGGASTASAA